MTTHRAELARASLTGAAWRLEAEGDRWRLVVDPTDGSRMVTRLETDEVRALAGSPAATFPPSTLVTPRLVLRRPELSDADAIYERYAQDPQVSRFMTWAAHGDVSDTRAWFEGAVLPAWQSGRGERSLAICLHDDTAPIGMLGMRDHYGVCLGYVLGAAWWGRGYMSEAVRAVSDAALAEPAVHRVWAFHDIDNVGSGRVLQKAGFTREGVLQRWGMAPALSDVPRDCVAWARVRD